MASHFILIAKTGEGSRDGLTAFAFHKDDPGWQIVRRIPIMGPEEHGGHCELTFDGLEIPDENRLMEVGQGLKLTQIRLGLARLTHCMRWLGLAQRCMEIANAYVAKREGFGIKLADRESVQMQLGRVAMAIDTGRLLTMRAAWRLEQGQKARPDISMAQNSGGRHPASGGRYSHSTLRGPWVTARTPSSSGSTGMPVRRVWWMGPARSIRW